MAKIPDFTQGIAQLIDAAHESEASPPRSHFGASLLGHACDRWLWLSFRWAVIEPFSGRMLRLFRRGQNEEATVVSDLRRIGCYVQNTGAKQSRVSFGGHVSGSTDGIIEYGVPDAMNTPHVLEIKTHSRKSFDALENEGVQKAKPQHYTQMQVYMRGLNLDRALYFAVCKDTDRIYVERVRIDKAHADSAIARGHRISQAARIPPKLSDNPSWFECKFCAAYSMCHQKEPTKEVNCRTCAHSTATPEGTWRCERHAADGIPVEYQREGCADHVLHPDLVPWPLDQDASNATTAVYLIDGKPVANGAKAPGVYASRELLENPIACAAADLQIEDIRARFNGEIVG